MTKHALVTGGLGFIGSNLVDALYEAGWQVDVVDDMSNGHLKFLESEENEINIQTKSQINEVKSYEEY